MLKSVLNFRTLFVLIAYFCSMRVDYIVVGLGLAGLAFVEEILAAKKTFVVFEDASQTSSLVAGGVYNPVILKRYTPVWNAKEQLEIALPLYKRIEEKLQIRIDEKFVIKKVFKSIEDQNMWFEACDKPKLVDYLSPDLDQKSYPGVVANFSFGNVQQAGRVDTEKLVTAYRSYLEKQGCIRFEKLVYEDIVLDDQGLTYKEITASKIVFCEGFGIKKNPFFKHLPLNGTKGEVITIHAPDLHIDFLLKSSLFVLPLGANLFKVGATFNWADKTSAPTEEGRDELVEKLDKILDIPYRIVKQSAGIRPTVAGRRPLVGVHQEHKQLLVLNGLGTRGVMIAPTMAKSLFNHVENGEALAEEIDIRRFA